MHLSCLTLARKKMARLIENYTINKRIVKGLSSYAQFIQA